MAPWLALGSRWPPILSAGRARSTAQRCDPSTLAPLINPFTERRERTLVIGLSSGSESWVWS